MCVRCSVCMHCYQAVIHSEQGIDSYSKRANDNDTILEVHFHTSCLQGYEVLEKLPSSLTLEDKHGENVIN